MKKFLTICFCAISILIFAQTPDFSIQGYAIVNGGTTGGQGGPVVTPTTIQELLNYTSDDEPRIILIDREFKGPNVLRMGSNKTLFGVGTSGFLNQVGVSIQSKNNIIIRNIKFTMKDVPISNDGENKIQGFNFDPDCIAIQADDDNLPESERRSHHIWIDHCEFYNESPSTQSDVDRYDGLLDMKNDVQYVTISWNYFHDHHKGCLNGKGNSDNFDRKTTMHHNKFENINSRMPLLRYGKLHMLNNYIVDCPDGNGVNVRIQSNAYVEKNYFENVKKPIFGKLSEGGKAKLVDNKFIDCSRLPAIVNTSDSPDSDPLSSSEEFETSSYTPPYQYSSICVPVNNVPSYVNQHVGIGKVAFTASAVTDCAGVQGGSASFDDCGVCSGGNTGNVPNSSCQDCNGDVNGTASVDECNVCSGGNTGLTPNECQIGGNEDCNGVENGSAFLDNCGTCVGGTTGLEACTISGGDCPNSSIKFGLVGYGNGTTGGAGGDEVTVSTGNALQDAIDDANGPRIIFINGTITPGNSAGLSKIDIKDVNNISIIGVGTSGELDGIGLKIWRSTNIIIQNVKIHHVLTGDKDGLNIEGPSENIWVDHCEFYNEYKDENGNELVGKDYYDALLDLKRDVFNVTISWNYFHDSWKASLSGSSESDTEDRNVTYHHNKYENINSRLPLFRSGRGHMFNNYYKDIASTTINSRINACAKIENNYFLNANNPYVSAYSDVVGFGDIEGNILVNSPFNYSGDVNELGSCSANISYNYSEYLNCADVVPSILDNYAGIGKLDAPINQLPAVQITSPSNGATFDDPASFVITATASDADGSISKVEFYNGTTLLGTDLDAPYEYQVSDWTIGSYSLTAIAYDNNNAIGTSSVVSVFVESSINLDCNGDIDGLAYLDNCGFCVAGNTGIEPCAVMEAEDACDFTDGSIDSDNAGFNGTGFVNTDNEIDVSVAWVINSTSDQNATLSFRFANGGTTSRDGQVLINGVVVGTLNLPSTGGWDVWQIATINVDLNEGANELVLVAISDGGLANLDQISFTEGVSDAQCGDIVTSVNEVNNVSSISIFPNPTSNTVNITQKASWELYNSQGLLLSAGNSDHINLTQFDSGIYTVRIDGSAFKVHKN